MLAWVIVHPQPAYTLHGTYLLYYMHLWFAWYLLHPLSRATSLWAHDATIKCMYINACMYAYMFV